MSKSERKSWQAACLVSLLVFAPSLARADADAIRSVDNEIWAAAGASFLNYKESVPSPDLPDSEHGFMPSGALGISALLNGSNPVTNNLYLALEGSGAFGTTHYNGAYFYDPTTPLQGTTKDTIWTVDGKIGKGIPITSNAMLIPYGELGYRYWIRNGGAGSYEDYRNYDIMAGLMLQLSPVSNIVLTGYGSAGTTLGAQATSSPDVYPLGSAGVYKVGGKISFLAAPFELFTRLDYDHFQYIQSPIQADNTYEPTSRTNDTTMLVGIGYQFR
jgi:hypothetical protein